MSVNKSIRFWPYFIAHASLEDRFAWNYVVLYVWIFMLHAFAVSAMGSDSYSIIRVMRHDPDAYTQGLQCSGNNLVESTGLYGQSSLRRYNIPNMELQQYSQLADNLFGEDITLWNGHIYQLTWREHILLKYDNNHTLMKRHHFSGEGWGLAHDGKQFIMSNGSNCLQLRDSKTFSSIRNLCLYRHFLPLGRINAMDYRSGTLAANLLPTDQLAIIDLEQEVVQKVIDLSDLRKYLTNPKAEILNGVCFLTDDEILVTGKRWDKIFHIRINNR